MILDRAASGEAKLDHEGGGQVNGFGLGPLGIFDYDDPVSIRARKYITGTHVLLPARPTGRPAGRERACGLRALRSR